MKYTLFYYTVYIFSFYPFCDHLGVCALLKGTLTVYFDPCYQNTFSAQSPRNGATTIVKDKHQYKITPFYALVSHQSRLNSVNLEIFDLLAENVHVSF